MKQLSQHYFQPRFGTSVCLLTFNISLSWVVLTLALALIGRLWVSLRGKDLPVCFGLHCTTLSTDSISSQHAVSGMQKDSPPNLDVFQRMLLPPSTHISHVSAEVTTWKWNPLPDWCITAVKFNPPRGELLFNWCGSLQVPVYSHFGNIVEVKLGNSQRSPDSQTVCAELWYLII